jgi:hypothetical protein
MTDRSILERNKAVLWARDVISRPDECLIATSGDSLPDCLTVTTMNGVEVASCSLLSSGAILLEEFTRAVNGKELVAVGLPENLTKLLRGRGIIVHDIVFYHGLYVNPAEPPVAVDVPPNELVSWVRDSLTRMAGSSLVLDQADTGAGKWTSSHFKPSPTMMDKLKSFIKT